MSGPSGAAARRNRGPEFPRGGTCSGRGRRPADYDSEVPYARSRYASIRFLARGNGRAEDARLFALGPLRA